MCKPNFKKSPKILTKRERRKTLKKNRKRKEEGGIAERRKEREGRRHGTRDGAKILENNLVSGKNQTVIAGLQELQFQSWI